jgi:hypothetical protein
MSRPLCALSAVTALFLAVSPVWAMSSSEAPSVTVKDGTLRVTDPSSSILKNFSLSFGTTNGQGYGGYGYGNGYGGYSSGYTGGYSNGYGYGLNNQMSGSNSVNPFSWGYVPSTNPGFSSSTRNGANLTDPTFGPNGLYSQGARTGY